MQFADGRANLGLAPLHWAASHGHLAAAQALIRWGATITARCNLFLEERGQASGDPMRLGSLGDWEAMLKSNVGSPAAGATACVPVCLHVIFLGSSFWH